MDVINPENKQKEYHVGDAFYIPKNAVEKWKKCYNWPFEEGTILTITDYDHENGSCRARILDEIDPTILEIDSALLQTLLPDRRYGRKLGMAADTRVGDFLLLDAVEREKMGKKDDLLEYMERKSIPRQEVKTRANDTKEKIKELINEAILTTIGALD